MIFMTVGDNHAANFVTVFFEIGDIGQDDIDAVHRGIRKRQTRIEQNNIVIAAEDPGIFTNFLLATKGNHLHCGGLVRHKHNILFWKNITTGALHTITNHTNDVWSLNAERQKTEANSSTR